MSTILVTGGAGYVGSVCSVELLRRGYDVVIVDDLSTGHREAVPSDAIFYEADIADKAAIRRIFRSHPIQTVFHFAAKALIPESVVNPSVFYQVNVSAGLALLDVMLEFDVKGLIFSSTAAVYGNPVQVPIPEDHPKSPVNSYGETKLAFERALEWYARAYRMSICAFRYFNAAGAIDDSGEMHDPESHIIPLLYEAACGEREFFTIYGADYETPDGTCLRDYVHVVDIADAHILAISHLHTPGFRAFNIGTGVAYSVRHVCKLASQVVGHDLPVTVGSRRLGDPAVLCADPRRLMTEFHWTPKHSALQDILTSAWAWKKALRAKALSGVPRQSDRTPVCKSQ